MHTAAVLIFDDAEVLDFAGPFEVLASTYLPSDGVHVERARGFDVFTVAAHAGIVRCRGDLLVQPTYTFATCPPVDVLVVPGGHGVLDAQEDRATVEWVRATAAAAKVATSVCTGSFLLAASGLLDGRPATSHWAELDAMRATYPNVDVRDDYRIVDLGRVITSAGVSAGLDMALHLVERLYGHDVAEATARGIEYRWQPVPTLVA